MCMRKENICYKKRGAGRSERQPSRPRPPAQGTVQRPAGGQVGNMPHTAKGNRKLVTFLTTWAGKSARTKATST